ncbi:GNAT family N-acetyltransferase [Spirosoma rigui]|uniref:GNAT family N-acetyltransferase n=1 Tax=Spirosoma rigui TaxID=564064 RepID=UPI0012D36109|nr:GNAT family N-acetyltransferase [Spirosoma rigui]
MERILPADSSALFIRPVQPTDWPTLAAIYQQGIDTGVATFETQAPTPDNMAVKYMAAPQLVAEQGGQVVGYALLSAVSDRCVYGGVAEVSVYIAASHRGQGIGKRLLDQLIKESEQLGLWTIQATVIAENKASIAVHKQAGFREVGYREKIVKHLGIWHDTVLLERRSTVAGL